ncbi:MAG: DciA family protein, partial [Pseudoalteromonas sp.]
PNLSKKCRVSQYQDGTLMIEAISAPIALRLNYLKMDILSHFRSQGMVELAQVKITANPQATQRLAPEMSVKGAQAAAPKKRKMSEKTAEHLNAIAADAPPSLKEKLQRLAKHAKG